MRVKRFLCILLACATMLGCLSVNAGAAEQGTAAAIMRATSKFNMDVPGNTLYTANMVLPLEIGETISINGTYTPRAASVDVGFIAPDGLFYSVSGEKGTFDLTVRVSQRGEYTLAVQNNSSNTVSVSGYVNY